MEKLLYIKVSVKSQDRTCSFWTKTCCLIKVLNAVVIYIHHMCNTAAIISHVNIIVGIVSVFYDRLSKQEFFEHAYNSGITTDKV